MADFLVAYVIGPSVTSDDRLLVLEWFLLSNPHETLLKILIFRMRRLVLSLAFL